MLWLFLFLLSLCWSHELWIEKRGEDYVLLYGHLRPGKGEEAQVRYSPEKVLAFECLASDGKRLPSSLSVEYPARLRGRCHMVQAVFSSGYWTRTPEGLKNLPGDGVKNPLESWYSLEVVRRIEVWSASRMPLGDQLEIVLLEDPSTLRLGQKFGVAVYYRGKPLRDAVVYHNGRVVGSTDEDGRINLRVRERGLQLVGTTVKEKDAGTKADYTLITFYLLFEVER